jgi:mono/diheme cytochrome c family protein
MSLNKTNCSLCHGSGKIPCPAHRGLNEGEERGTRIVNCSLCHGSKTIVCPTCRGTGIN